MAIIFAVLSFVFARQLGRALGYIAGCAIAALAMIVVAPVMVLAGAFRRRKALRARRHAAQVVRQEAPERPTAPAEAPRRPKAPVVPIRSGKRP